jgi:valyl-tRNA synthetase
VAPFPSQNGDLVDAKAEAEIAFLQEIVVALRNAKQESNLPAQKKTPAYVTVESDHYESLLKQYAQVISRMAIIEEPVIGIHGRVKVPALSAINAGAHFEVAIPLEGLLDIGVEKDRLTREIAKIEKDKVSISGRLGNAAFVAKAPPEVIEEHRKQLAELEKRCEKITASLKRFEKFVS